MRSLKLMLMILLIPAALLACDGGNEGKPLGGIPTDNRMPGLGEVAPAVVFEAPDAGLADLIPKDAIGVIYVASAEDMFEKLSAMASRVDPEAADELQLDEMLGGMLDQFRAGSLTTEMLDMSRPMAIAGILIEGRRGLEPMPVLILPVKDADAADAAVDGGERGPSHAAAGGYLAFCPAPEVQLGTGGSKLGGDMPAGDIVARFDLAALIKTFGDDLQGPLQDGLMDGLEDAPPNLAGIGETIQGLMKDFMDSAEGLDICASIGDEMVDLHCFFTAKEGSAFASTSAPSGDLISLAGCLPGDYPLSMLISADLAKMGKWLEPLMESSFEALPPASAEQFGEFWKKWMGMAEGLGNEIVAAMDFGEGGIRMVEVFTAKDANKFMADMESMMSEDISGVMKDMGMDLKIGEKTELAGHQVHNWTMIIDAEKLLATQPGAGTIPPDQLEAMQGMFDRLLGEGGMHMRMAAVGNRIVAAMGTDDADFEKALAAAGASGVGPSGTLNDAVNRIGATPKFLMHLDLRKFAIQMMDMVRTMMPPSQRSEVPEIPAGGAIPFTVYYTGDGRKYAMGTSLNLGAILDMVKHFEGQK